MSLAAASSLLAEVQPMDMAGVDLRRTAAGLGVARGNSGQS